MVPGINSKLGAIASSDKRHACTGAQPSRVATLAHTGFLKMEVAPNPSGAKGTKATPQRLHSSSTG